MNKLFDARLMGCAGLAALMMAASANAAELRGRVIDAATGATLPGATVNVGGVTAAAGPDGRFSVSGVPEGEQEITVSYVGYQDAKRTATLADAAAMQVDLSLDVAGSVSELVVTGQRAAERRALQTQKSANNLVSTLYANDVGKLPDQNVAEAVRRLPGISVANDQGEGRYVVIRGVNPNLANVTLNGQTAPAPEPEGRQVKLDDIPSALIGRVDVIKSLTPDLDANAIAGQVDISTLSAFDKRGLFAYVRGAYGQYDINDENPYEGDVTLGGTFGPDKQFGAVVAANYSERPIRSENFQPGPGAYVNVNSVLVPGAVVPNSWVVRDYNLTRKRTGYVANFDYRPNEAISVFLRGSYSKFSDNETRDQFSLTNASAITPATLTTGTLTARAERRVRRRQEDSNTKTISAGAKFLLPVGELKIEGAWSKAEKGDPLRSEFVFRASPNVAGVAYDLSDEYFTFTPPAAAYDPTKFNFQSVNYDIRKAVETLKQARADYTLPITAWGADTDVKVGVKITDREKSNNRDITAYSAGTAYTLALANPATSALQIYDGRYAFGPRVVYDNAQAFFTANPTARTLNVSGSLTNSLVNDYEAHEKVYAAYAMAELKDGRLTVIPGVRVERTEGDYRGKTIKTGATVNDPFNQFGDFSYTHVLPGVNVRFAATDDVILRAAATTSIGRPNYADLAPFVSADSAANTLSLGNPDLKAQRSLNLDAGAEYYLPGQGVISAGVFSKTIQKAIFSGSRTPTPAEIASYGVSASANVTQAFNAGEANVYGVELNAQSQFASLPGALSGLGASANVTFINSQTSSLPGRQEFVPLLLQSDQVGAAQLFYEKYGITARVAYSWRTKYLLSTGGNAAADQYVDAYQSVDARVGYTFLGKAITVFAEGANLSDEPYRIIQGGRLIESERYGATYRAGLQLAF